MAQIVNPDNDRDHISLANGSYNFMLRGSQFKVTRQSFSDGNFHTTQWNLEIVDKRKHPWAKEFVNVVSFNNQPKAKTKTELVDRINAAIKGLVPYDQLIMAKQCETSKNLKIPKKDIVDLKRLQSLLQSNERTAQHHFNKYLASNARIDRDRCLKTEARIGLLRELISDTKEKAETKK